MLVTQINREIKRRCHITPELESENSNSVSYDLVTEQWISVTRYRPPNATSKDGNTICEVGLIEALCKADEWEGIQHSLPLVEFGLYRLLVALVLDIFKPQNRGAWSKLWRQERFDEATIREYFEQYRNRFDLFNPMYPFLQCAGMEGEEKPLAGLLPSQPSGTNASHFHHQEEDTFAVSPAAAAQLLTTIAPFMTAGGAGLPPSINGAPPWYVLVKGKNLFETLLLNTPVGHIAGSIGVGEPIWRSEDSVERQDITEASLLQAFTWQPRRILLCPHFASGGTGRCHLTGRETPVLVSRMKFTAGWSTRIENWRDPNAAYRITKDRVTILRPRENHALWRDAGALMFTRHQTHADVQFDRPALISQYEQFVDRSFEAEGVPLKLVGYGMRTDLKMKVFEWHREGVELPAPLLWQGEFFNRVEGAMRLAEDVAYSLRNAIKKTYPRDGAGNNNAFESLITRSQVAFWQRLRSAFLEDYLPQIAKLNAESNREAVAERNREWQQAVKHIGWRCLDQAIDDLDADGESIHKQTEARRYFAQRLWMLFNPDDALKRKTKKQGATT